MRSGLTCLLIRFLPPEGGYTMQAKKKLKTSIPVIGNRSILSHIFFQISSKVVRQEGRRPGYVAKLFVRRAGGPATSQSCSSGGPAARLRRKVVRQEGRWPGHVAKLGVRRAIGPATSQSCSSGRPAAPLRRKIDRLGPAARLRREFVRCGASGELAGRALGCLLGVFREAGGAPGQSLRATFGASRCFPGRPPGSLC